MGPRKHGTRRGFAELYCSARGPAGWAGLFGGLVYRMTTVPEDLDRRRPIWEALSDLFLDTELTEAFYRFIAQRIIESGYTPAEVRRILWAEVFPVIEFNLRHPAGVWEGFRGDWLQETILGAGEKQTAAQQPGTATIVREPWSEVCRYLPGEFT